MPWTRGQPTAAKYRTSEHRRLRSQYAQQIKAGEYVACTAAQCILPSRQITNPDGRARNGLHLGHNDDGVTYAGPQHAACNVRDGATRARAKQLGRVPTRRDLVL